MPEILRLQSVSRRFGGLQALRDISLTVNRGEVIGLIGPNGAGKTTLVNVVTGVTPATGGAVVFDGEDITKVKTYRSARLGLSRTFQIVQPFAEFSALDNVAAAALFSWLSVMVPYWNWYRFPTSFTVAGLIEQVVGWLLAGAVMAWWLGRRPRQVA